MYVCVCTFMFFNNAFSYAHIQNAWVNVFTELDIYTFISSMCNVLSNCDFKKKYCRIPSARPHSPKDVNAFFVHLYFITILFTVLLDSLSVPALGVSPTNVFTMGLQQAKNKTRWLLCPTIGGQVPKVWERGWVLHHSRSVRCSDNKDHFPADNGRQNPKMNQGQQRSLWR